MPDASTAKASVQKRDRLIGAALWLETTGLLFGAFTVMGGAALLRQYRADHFHDHQRFLLVGVFTVVCAWGTLVSFMRARRTRK